jgi:hypothetical protein
MNGIPVPVPVLTLVYKKFKENNLIISLYIYEWHNQNKCLEFQYVLKKKGEEYRPVNLLVIIKEDRSYHCIIKDLHKLCTIIVNIKSKNTFVVNLLLSSYILFRDKIYEHLLKCKNLNNATQRS